MSDDAPMTTATYRHFPGSAAEAYERFFVPAIATPVSAGLLDRAALRTGERVLDVACGTGAITRLAARAVGPTGSVVGVDLAPDMIEVAESTPAPGGPRIEWHEADAEALPLPDAHFDVVVCQMGLMFMHDPAGAVAEMYRVLRPGGRVVVNTPGPIQPPFVEMERAIGAHVDPHLGGFVSAVFAMHDPAVVRAILAAAGFETSETAEYSVPLELPAPAEFLWQYISLTPMAPLVAGAPPEARAAMEAHMSTSLASSTVDGRLCFTQPMVMASGHRN